LLASIRTFSDDAVNTFQISARIFHCAVCNRKLADQQRETLMATTMTFAKVKAYLTAIADNPRNSGDIDMSPHGRFWDVSYHEFTTGDVPGGSQVKCNGNASKIMDTNHPDQSPFYLALTSPNGWCNLKKMPFGGPYITDMKPAPYEVTLPDGTTVTGSKIQSDLLEWLQNGFPET
jgi:hypothetical protein